jgi:hypothetical protein
MKRFLTDSIILAFWASPNNSIYDLILRSNCWAPVRRARALDPGFPREDPVEQPPRYPVAPIPTDVPIPDPHDVPVYDPKDVPPPNPGVVPKPAQPPPTKKVDPKPRPMP